MQFFRRFKEKVLNSGLYQEQKPGSSSDFYIALGVLLWTVAEADNKFLPEEEKKIESIFSSTGKIDSGVLPLVMASVKQAALERVDLFTFTSEVSEELVYKDKIKIIEDLFSVACADKELDETELEHIRKIANLFHLSHSDFIQAKLKIKKEYDL